MNFGRRMDHILKRMINPQKTIVELLEHRKHRASMPNSTFDQQPMAI